jgi:hypothetical protein
MNRERLEHLRKIILDAPDKHFDMSTWAKGGRTLCGTTLCAGGWAALDPEFQARGLRLLSRGMEIKSIQDLSPKDIWVDILYQEGEGFYALSLFFDLPHREVNYLFGGEPADPSRQGFVERLDEIITDNSPR